MNIWTLILVALLYRIVFIAFGFFQDNRDLKYTDIDYEVFFDGARWTNQFHPNILFCKFYISYSRLLIIFYQSGSCGILNHLSNERHIDIHHYLRLSFSQIFGCLCMERWIIVVIFLFVVAFLVIAIIVIVSVITVVVVVVVVVVMMMMMMIMVVVVVVVCMLLWFPGMCHSFNYYPFILFPTSHTHHI